MQDPETSLSSSNTSEFAPSLNMEQERDMVLILSTLYWLPTASYTALCSLLKHYWRLSQSKWKENYFLSHSILLPTRHCRHLNYSWSPTAWVPRTVSCDPYSLPQTFKSWYFQTRKGSGWQKFVIVFVWYSLLYNVLSIENKIGNLLVADWNFCRSA